MCLTSEIDSGYENLEASAWRKLFDAEVAAIYIKSNGPVFPPKLGLVDQLLQLQEQDPQSTEMIGWAVVLGEASTAPPPQYGPIPQIWYNIGPGFILTDEPLRSEIRPQDQPMVRCLARAGILSHSRLEEYLQERGMSVEEHGIQKVTRRLLFPPFDP